MEHIFQVKMINELYKKDGITWKLENGIEKIDNTRGEYDDKVWQNQEEKRKVQSMVGRYKKQAMRHLDSVCIGKLRF